MRATGIATLLFVAGVLALGAEPLPAQSTSGRATASSRAGATSRTEGSNGSAAAPAAPSAPAIRSSASTIGAATPRATTSGRTTRETATTLSRGRSQTGAAAGSIGARPSSTTVRRLAPESTTARTGRVRIQTPAPELPRVGGTTADRPASGRTIAPGQVTDRSADTGTGSAAAGTGGRRTAPLVIDVPVGRARSTPAPEVRPNGRRREARDIQVAPVADEVSGRRTAAASPATAGRREAQGTGTATSTATFVDLEPLRFGPRPGHAGSGIRRAGGFHVGLGFGRSHPFPSTGFHLWLGWSPSFWFGPAWWHAPVWLAPAWHLPVWHAPVWFTPVWLTPVDPWWWGHPFSFSFKHRFRHRPSVFDPFPVVRKRSFRDRHLFHDVVFVPQTLVLVETTVVDSGASPYQAVAEPEPPAVIETCARVTFQTTAGTGYDFLVALPALDALTGRELQLTLERDLARGDAPVLVTLDGIELRLSPDAVRELQVLACPS